MSYPLYKTTDVPADFEARNLFNPKFRTLSSLAAIALFLASCGTPALRSNPAFPPIPELRPSGEGRQEPKKTADYGGSAKRVAAPFAHIYFCKQNPSDCNTIGDASFVQLTHEKRSELSEVNDEVNAEIQPQADDPTILGGDVWTLAPTAGDCDDYAVTKRHKLLELGWPSGVLRLAEGVTRDGEAHLVLIAATDQGELVLDNETSQIKSPARSGLRWKAIQSALNPRVWLSFDGSYSAVRHS